MAVLRCEGEPFETVSVEEALQSAMDAADNKVRESGRKTEPYSTAVSRNHGGTRHDVSEAVNHGR